MSETSAQAMLSPRQYTAMLAGSAFGAGILTLPRYLCAAGGQDAWIIPLPAAPCACPHFFFCSYAAVFPA